MTKQRRTYKSKFRREAVSLVFDQGYSNIDVARLLALMESALRCW